MWAKFRTDNMDTKYGEKFSVVMLLDRKAEKALLDAGYRGKIKDTEEGLVTTFSRKNEDEYGGGPPRVYTPDDTEYTGNIGNGSNLSILLEIYDSRFGKGCRMKEVRINKLVEYKRSDEAPPPLPVE